MATWDRCPAIEVIRTLKERGVVTRHPLQVVIWQNEEGGLVGSHAAFGDALDLEQQFNGIRLADGLRKVGGDPDRLAEARMPPGTFHCYLELHIEQGGNLDKAGIPIGVVDGIVSIDEQHVGVSLNNRISRRGLDPSERMRMSQVSPGSRPSARQRGVIKNAF